MSFFKASQFSRNSTVVNENITSKALPHYIYFSVLQNNFYVFPLCSVVYKEK